MKRLTKSQYEVIATVISDDLKIIQDSDKIVLRRVANNLAGTFAYYDDQFDRTRFLALCGIED